MSKHCEETEPCVEDYYCNCSCELCNNTMCGRPGCGYNVKTASGCKKIHPGFCKITKNECGSDTWNKNSLCSCDQCAEYLKHIHFIETYKKERGIK